MTHTVGWGKRQSRTSRATLSSRRLIPCARGRSRRGKKRVLREKKERKKEGASAVPDEWMGKRKPMASKTPGHNTGEKKTHLPRKKRGGVYLLLINHPRRGGARSAKHGRRLPAGEKGGARVVDTVRGGGRRDQKEEDP